MSFNSILLLGITLIFFQQALCDHRDNFIELKLTPVESDTEKVNLEWEPIRHSEQSLPVVLNSCKLQLNSTSKLDESKTKSDSLYISVNFKYLSATDMEPASDYKIQLLCNGTKDTIWSSDILSFTTGGNVTVGKPSMREYLLASMGKIKSSFNTHLSLSRDQLIKNIAKLKSELMEWKQKMPFLRQQ